MVDLVGIEPTTSSMPWKRAPSCATGPHGGYAGTPAGFIVTQRRQLRQLRGQTRPDWRHPFWESGYGT